MVNLSSRQLSNPEESVLNKRLNYAVSPQAVLVEEFVVATEVVCDRLDAKDKEEIRSKVTAILRHPSPPSSNITRNERQAIKDLKKDNNIVILPADKGKITVVLDSNTYEEKVNALLSDNKNYSQLDKDPTTAYKNRFLKLLKELKEKGVH